MEELSPLVLGIRIPHNAFRRVELPAVNLDWNVEEIKAEAVKLTGISTDQISVPIVVKTMSDKEIQQLALAFRTFALNSGHRSTLAKLSRPETLENILMAVPGLNQDAFAVSIIRDPELLVHMGDPATIKRVLEQHPVLAEAANYIAAAVHEETAAARHSRRGRASPAAASTAASAAYSNDALSGEEMDSSQSSDSPPARSSSSSMGGITSSQLEAALAAVGTVRSGASTSGASSSRNSGQDRSGLITPEMFNTALQQAFQGIAIPNFSSELGIAIPNFSVTPRGIGATTNAPENPFTFAERMSQQLQQMRELGLRDQVFNLQALQITNGDVQAAIELVMSSGNNGRDEDDEEDNAFRQ